jgi:LPPG:FO 2-phospho-L-lactate transferase
MRKDGGMHIVVLAGGVGGARFLQGVRAVAAGRSPSDTPPTRVTAVVNTADDVTLHGLRICPDLDSVMYTLGGGIDPERGWGRAGETWTVKEELAAYGTDAAWFGLGDRDVATHLVRTRMLDAGYPLSAVTEALCDRWQPGVRLLPMSDDRVETHVVIGGDAGDEKGRRAMHFQEWWVRHRAAPQAEAFVPVGAADAKPAPGVLDALATADVVLIAPSNPVVSIATILAVPGIRDAVRGAPGPVVGVSPIIGGAPVRGMAEKCLPTVGVEVSAAGVGGFYAARRDAGLLDSWLVDTADAGTDVPGVEVRAVPLYMHDTEATAAIVSAALGLAAGDAR